MSSMKPNMLPYNISFYLTLHSKQDSELWQCEARCTRIHVWKALLGQLQAYLCHS